MRFGCTATLGKVAEELLRTNKQHLHLSSDIPQIHPEARGQLRDTDIALRRQTGCFHKGPLTGPETGTIYAYGHHQCNAPKFPRILFLAVLGKRMRAHASFQVLCLYVLISLPL